MTWNPEKEQKHWDELSAADYLAVLRKEQALSLGPSFDTIAAFGPNSALPHYSATVATNRTIDNSSLFMVDSGGQYLGKKSGFLYSCPFLNQSIVLYTF